MSWASGPAHEQHKHAHVRHCSSLRLSFALRLAWNLLTRDWRSQAGVLPSMRMKRTPLPRPPPRHTFSMPSISTLWCAKIRNWQESGASALGA